MSRTPGIVGLVLFGLGILGPIAGEWLPGEPNILILAAPVCWVAGTICGAVAWRTWPGRLALAANGLALGLIGAWIVFLAPRIRWG